MNLLEIRERQKDAPWSDVAMDITVGGAGGIGSWLTFLLARLNDKNTIYVYDDDEIEVLNIGGQLYPTTDVGRYKVDALSVAIDLYSNFNIAARPMKFDKSSYPTPVMFSAFDNMKARKDMAEMWIEYQKEKKRKNLKMGDGLTRNDFNIFIDGRMEAEQAIIYAVDSIDDYRRYMDEFFDDSEVALGPCTFRATSHNAALIAGQMVTILTNKVFNVKHGGKFRTVPFKVTYELPTMTYNIEM